MITKNSHFHFVGINGIGMSAIAKILYKQGHTVSGCDLATHMTHIQELITAGCTISHQHNSEICHDASITTVVYSSDVPYDAPELAAARSKGIATVQRAAVLAEIMAHNYSIGVAGSHGKTTTTAMIGHILTQAELDPTIIVGGIMNNFHNNARYGKSDYVVAETDESDRSHLLLPVRLGVITNIDFEHANTYKNLNDVIEVFRKFIDQIPPEGNVIVCADDPNIRQIYQNHGFDAGIITYGTNPKSSIRAVNIRLYPTSSTFDIEGSLHLTDIIIDAPSIYNVLNATAAIATAHLLDIPHETIKSALRSFQGVDRRFTLKGTMQHPAVQIYDDYGHHPTEIHHSLITARRKTTNKLTVVFQPQRYTRTYHLWDDFIKVFQQADVDHLIITDIYTANEPAIDNVTSQRLVQEIQAANPQAKIYYVPFQADLQTIKEQVLQVVGDDDLLLLLGAGKVNGLAEKLLKS